MLSTVKGVDMYPKTITFTFKGQEEFKTLFGGIISLIIKIVILLYTYQMISIMITNKNSSKNVNTTVQNILNDTDPINLTDTKFQFAIRATIDGIDFDVFNEPSYGTASIDQFYVNQRVFNRVPIGVSRCGNNFRYDNQQEIDDLKLSEFYCPDSRNLSVLGNILSETVSYFSFSIARQEYDVISRCNNATSAVTCQSNTTIDSIMSKVQIRLYVVNTYFDFEDYDNPIKTYLDDRFLFYLIPGFSLNIGVRLQKNEAEIQDDYFAFAPGGNNKEFIGFDTVMERMAMEGNPDESLLAIIFTKDPSSKSYDRSVFTVLEAFGNIGGLLEIFSIAGGLIVGLFAERLFFYTIFSKMYLLEESEKPSQDGRIPTSKVMNARENKDSSEASLKDIEYSHRQCERNVSFDENCKEELSEKARQSIQRRFNYDWRFTDLFYNACGYFKFMFHCCVNKKNNINVKRRLEYYSKGQDKYAHEFDAVRFCKSMRNLQALVRSLLDDSEKYIIKHQRSNVLTFDESGDDTDIQEDNDKKTPKLFANLVNKMLYRIKINKFINDYMNEEWTEQDYKLVSGVFSKKSLKNNQIETMMDQNHSRRPCLTVASMQSSPKPPNIKTTEESKDHDSTTFHPQKLATASILSLMKPPSSKISKASYD
ncbi:unnamed protein product [Moneuplotes crassus]|uniref:Uncharacterized protein n=1 Tax=Euplotes crassus TaxID=5936 RepID=A0AAD2D9I1_EUPCR|nr:unnamed protein product [Moneuplotes crassus]